MKVERSFCRAMVAAGTLLFIVSPKAQIVSFNFAGTVSGFLDTIGAWPAEITGTGTPFTGTFTYDSSATDSSSDPTRGAYSYPSAVGFSMSVTIGSHTFATGSPSPNQ